MTRDRLSFQGILHIPLIKSGDDLAAILAKALRESDAGPQDGDVLVLAQKIVSKAEGREVVLSEVRPSDEARRLAAETDKDPRVVELILAESSEVLKSKQGVLIVVHRLGHVTASAGIDRSNVGPGDDRVLLLPENPDQSAGQLRAALEEHFGVRLGVVISDSVGRPWRLGTVGLAIGCAGLEVIADHRGRRDLFGHELEISMSATADALAGAAEVLMGAADEAMPAVLVRSVEAGTVDQDVEALLRPKDEDLFR